MIDKKRAMVVGASRGLGKAIAIECINQGYSVTIVSRTIPDWLKTYSKSNITHISADFTSTGIAIECLETYTPDLLVLNVAKGLFRSPLLINEQDVFSTVNHTLTANIVWINQALNTLLPKSKIAIVLSLTALLPDEYWAVYAASKAGILHYVRSIQPTATSKEISLTLCFPGCLETKFHEESGATIPSIAVKPEELSLSMLSTIESDERFWSAPMDKSIVDEIILSSEQLIEKFQGDLK